MSAIARIRRISMWALKVFEFGPQVARDEALRIISKCNKKIDRLLDERKFEYSPSRESEDVEHFLDAVAIYTMWFYLENLIKAPPGVHKRLMKRAEYRSRISEMRVF